MTNRDIAVLLDNIAAAYELLGESRFRINAYRQASDSIENLSRDLKSIWEEGFIRKVPGIGASLAGHFDELFEKGESTHFKEVESKMPAGMFDYLKLRGVGPKTAFRLASEIEKRNIVGTTSLDCLQALLQSHVLLELEGFGEKREKEIFESIVQFREGVTKKQRLLLPEAEAIANKLCTYISEHKLVTKVEVLGSLRRSKDTVGDLDIAVATKNGAEVAEHILLYPDIKKIDDKGKTRIAFIVDGAVQVDVRLINPSQFGSMIQYFTGSKYHNIKVREHALAKGLSVSEWGIKNKSDNSVSEFRDEKAFYAHLGLSYIPPEMREDHGEVELAKQGKLPSLVELSDIKGDVHIHGDFDYPSSHDFGRSSLSKLSLSAVEKGYEYIGIADHNPKIKGLEANEVLAIMKARKSYYEHNSGGTKSDQNKASVKKVFIMLEIDIRPDGQLALAEKGFEHIHAAIASIHSSFTQEKEVMTNRILKGLSHPKVRILGHPTGRLLNKRESIQADWNAIFAYCKERSIALEINASTQRLDLPDSLVREARKVGVKFVINTDSHHVEHMDQMKYGVAVARRGWLTKSDILNTRPAAEFEKWLLNKK